MRRKHNNAMPASAIFLTLCVRGRKADSTFIAVDLASWNGSGAPSAIMQEYSQIKYRVEWQVTW